MESLQKVMTSHALDLPTLAAVAKVLLEGGDPQEQLFTVLALVDNAGTKSREGKQQVYQLVAVTAAATLPRISDGSLAGRSVDILVTGVLLPLLTPPQQRFSTDVQWLLGLLARQVVSHGRALLAWELLHAALEHHRRPDASTSAAASTGVSLTSDKRHAAAAGALGWALPFHTLVAAASSVLEATMEWAAEHPAPHPASSNDSDASTSSLAVLAAGAGAVGLLALGAEAPAGMHAFLGKAVREGFSAALAAIERDDSTGATVAAVLTRQLLPVLLRAAATEGDAVNKACKQQLWATCRWGTVGLWCTKWPAFFQACIHQAMVAFDVW